jgi:hypothetical protein
MATFSFPSAATQSDSMLLTKLPREMLVRIIRLAVVDEEDDDITPIITYTWDRRSRRSSGRIEIEHPILQTCKQLRRESAKIFFLENSFVLNCELPVVRSPVPRDVRSDMNEMAAATLARAFGSYASKVWLLVVSHWIEFETGVDVEVEVDIRGNRDRPDVWFADVDVHEEETPDDQLCRCRIFQFEADNATSENVLEFVQRYVR